MLVSVLALVYFAVARACGYNHAAIVSYGLYVALYVLLPGTVLLLAANRRWPTLLMVFAAALPLGFAAEISTFLALSAMHLRPAMTYTPAIWILIALLLVRRRIPNDWMPSLRSGGIGIHVLGTAVIGAILLVIVTRFYPAAEMSRGVLASSTHQDWIYLLSRAAEIKERWPLEDPSMAGAKLSYHYFLLIHLASASLVAHVNLEMLGLRQFVLPLSAALLAQCVLLGRQLGGRPASGLISGLLLFAACEVSFRGTADNATFGNYFLEWLFVSPTFFFGLIFTGALLIWVHRLASERQPAVAWAILFALAAVGTGAKGTVLPPLIVALFGWLLWDCWTHRRLSMRLIAILAIVSTAFGVVYFTTMAEWGAGAAEFSPLLSLKLTAFWQEHVPNWEHGLTSVGCPLFLARSVAGLVGGIAVVLGFVGVRLLGLLVFLNFRREPLSPLAAWIGLAALSYALFGLCLSLDSHAQLYLWYTVQLPLSILGGAGALKAFDYVVRCARAEGPAAGAFQYAFVVCTALVGCATLVFAKQISLLAGFILVTCTAFVAARPREKGGRIAPQAAGRFALRTIPVACVLIVFAVQFNHWCLRGSTGFSQWLHASPTGRADALASLRDGAVWIHQNTPKNAVFVTNAFTDKNLLPNRLATIDGTTVDKYFYYSALTGRRFWVEGPAYLRNQGEALRRVQLASRVFYDGESVSTLHTQRSRPDYILLDKALNDGARVALPQENVVFENSRLAVYRVAPFVKPAFTTNTATNLR